MRTVKVFNTRCPTQGMAGARGARGTREEVRREAVQRKPGDWVCVGRVLVQLGCWRSRKSWRVVIVVSVVKPGGSAG